LKSPSILLKKGDFEGISPLFKEVGGSLGVCKYALVDGCTNYRARKDGTVQADRNPIEVVARNHNS